MSLFHPHDGDPYSPCRWMFVDGGPCGQDYDAAIHAPASRTELVAGYISKWQTRLGLSEWIIRYNPDGKIAKDGAASNSHDPYRLLCEVRIGPKSPDDELENSVLHELLHLVVEPVTEMAHQFAGATGDKRLSPVLMDMVHAKTERMIEQIAFALSGKRQTEIWWQKKQMPMFQVKPKDAA